jgi:hypothetical protein
MLQLVFPGAGVISEPKPSVIVNVKFENKGVCWFQRNWRESFIIVGQVNGHLVVAIQ